MPRIASSPQLQINLAAVVLVVAGTGLCATSAVAAHAQGRPLWDAHLWLGGLAVAFGSSILGTLGLGHLLERRAHRRVTLQAGRTRSLVSLSQAADFLRLTGRAVPAGAAEVFARHDGVGPAAVRALRVPRYERDPNLLVDWVESGEPIELYALALLAAIDDADLRAHLSGEDLLDPVLMSQRAVNIRTASLASPA